jgi:uncharacterized linocin/CFP29 family protein
MATATTAVRVPTKNRGKDQIHWTEDVWKRIDAAVTDEMVRTRVAAKFLPLVHVAGKETIVDSDIVRFSQLQTVGDSSNQTLSVDESQVNRINEFWVEFLLTPTQEEKERSDELAMIQGQRASTAITLAMRSANILAQAEDTVLLNGQNAFHAPLFQKGGPVQFRDPNLKTNLGLSHDLGLLNIAFDGSIALDKEQIILVPPAVQGAPPRYAENTLDAVARGFSVLQSLGHYEGYALVLHTIPYADLHTALSTTLITPVEPISHIVKAGVHGTGLLPPFDGKNAGLPDPHKLPQGVNLGGANILYTGVLVSLAGNTMDHVRGSLDTDGYGKDLDVATTFNQKDVNENHRFRVLERFTLRLKDTTAVILFLFLDAIPQ